METGTISSEYIATIVVIGCTIVAIGGGLSWYHRSFSLQTKQFDQSENTATRDNSKQNKYTTGTCSKERDDRIESRKQNNKNPPLSIPTTSTMLDSNGNEIIDAWEERRRRGIAIHSLHEKKDVHGKEEKPFGSSYYYAHNNTKAKGGYSDGLRMEDFTMNQPRLLSKGNSSICENDYIQNQQQQQDVEAYSCKDTIHIETAPSTKLPSKRILQISKYLWDDSGSKNGEGSIRIELLPISSTETISWEQYWKDNSATMSVSTDFDITKDGVIITIQSTTSNIDYRFEIKNFFGPVVDVKTLVKSKRLIVKLTKKTSLFDKSNLKAWPHPQKKF
jgi:hypothetical protein